MSWWPIFFAAHSGGHELKLYFFLSHWLPDVKTNLWTSWNAKRNEVVNKCTKKRTAFQLKRMRTAIATQKVISIFCSCFYLYIFIIYWHLVAVVLKILRASSTEWWHALRRNVCVVSLRCYRAIVLQWFHLISTQLAFPI